MRICPNCGVPNPDGNKCCESCGADMISGNSTGNSSDKSHSEQQEVKNSGLIETMGNTRHVTDPERKETGDVQKHVSGFGLVGSMGNVHYDGDQLEKEEHSKSGEKGDGARETGIDKAYLSTVDDAAKPENPKPVKGRLVESIGERKYETDTKAEEASPPKTSKMMGKMGDTEYRYAPDESKESDKSKPLESGAKLIGSVGERKYKTDAKAENSAKKTSKITGRMGDTEYHYESDISKTPDESKPSEIKGKLYGNIGTASYVYESREADVPFENKEERVYRAERTSNVPLKGRVGSKSYNSKSKVTNSRELSGGEPPRRAPRWIWVLIASAAVLTLITLIAYHNFGSKEPYNLDVVQNSMAEVNLFAQSLTEDDGYISEEQTQYVIDAVYTQALSQPGVLSCEKDEYGLLIHTESGFDYVYTPPIRDTDNYGTTLKIITCQPYCTANKQNNYGFDLDAPDICANEAAATDPRWSFAASDDVNDADVNMDRILHLDDYKLILWHGHGGYTKKTGYYLCTTIPLNNSLLSNYSCITQTNSVVLLDGTLALKPSFFDENFEKGAFDNAFIYFATCFSGKEEAFARVFINKGAAVVFVNSESINRGYNLDMLHIIVESFFLGVDAPTVRKAINELGPHYSFNTPGMWTVADCLALAKLYYGSKDQTRLIKAAEVYYLGKSNVGNLTYSEWMSCFSTAYDPLFPETEPTSSPVNTTAPQASEEERQAARLAYAEFLHAGVTLSKSKWGGECEADHYYLFDMNGDGLEEMIAYTSPRSLEWTFAVYTYANGQVTQIADSINTCDISEWSNAAITAEISNGVLHAYVGKANAAYEGGSDNYLFFNGKNVKNYRNGDGLPVPFGCAAFTLFKNDDDYGILIGSDQDFLSRLYYQKHPPATPAPEATPAMGTDLIADGDYYAQLTSWDSDTMTIELLKLEGVCEWSDNLILSNTGSFFTLDVSRATICLDAVWGSGEEIQCDSIDDALNTIVWGNTYLRDACSMQISITVRNSQVSKIVFLYRA